MTPEGEEVIGEGEYFEVRQLQILKERYGILIEQLKQLRAQVHFDQNAVERLRLQLLTRAPRRASSSIFLALTLASTLSRARPPYSTCTLTIGRLAEFETWYAKQYLDSSPPSPPSPLAGAGAGAMHEAFETPLQVGRLMLYSIINYYLYMHSLLCSQVDGYEHLPPL